MMYKKLKNYSNNLIHIKSHLHYEGGFFVNNKKSFSLIELIFAILLISILNSQFTPKKSFSKLNLAANKIILYLKYTRYIAMLDNKFKIEDDQWFRERWTLKFQNCSKKVKGLYYLIYSDKNHKGSPNKNECLKDPVTNKYLYSHYDCNAGKDESKYILLTKEFGIEKINISCNNTSTIGQIIFDNSGAIHVKHAKSLEKKDTYILNKTCYIKMYDIDNNCITIVLEPETGFIHKQ